MSDRNDDTVEIERQNVFEDIALAVHSYSVTILTVGALFTARRINFSGYSYKVGGRITDERVQKAIDASALITCEVISAVPLNGR